MKAESLKVAKEGEEECDGGRGWRKVMEEGDGGRWWRKVVEKGGGGK